VVERKQAKTHPITIEFVMKQLTATNFDDAVQIALDANQMLGVFRKHFEAAPNSLTNGLRIQDCRLVRLRWRGGKRAVLQYELDAATIGNTETFKQLLTSSIHDEKCAEHVEKKLLRDNSCVDNEAIFKPVSAISQLNMLVQAFPFDRRLPHLKLLAHTIPTAIRESIDAHYGPAKIDYSQCKITSVRYRAGLSAVLRYDLPIAGSTAHESVFAKLYQDPSEATRTFRMLTDLAAKENELGIECARPIAVLPALSTLLLQGVTGRTLEDELQLDSSVKQVRKAARAIARLNGSRVKLERVHTAEAQAESLQRATDRLRQACPQLKARISHVANRILPFPDVDLHPTHRDLKPEHIFFTGEAATLIDCDSMAMADPVIDPAMMLARMAAMSATDRLAYNAFRKNARVFVDEYFKQGPIDWNARLNQYYASALLEIAVGFFGRQEPGWRETITYLVEEAERSLNRQRWE